jgi:hypothetical protein
MIESILNDFTKVLPPGVERTEIFLLDNQMRLLRADYVTYKAYPVENDMIYKLFFRTQSVEAQLRR